MFDYEALKFWWTVLITLGNIGVWVFIWFSSKDKGNEIRMAAHEKLCVDGFARVDNRLIRVETEIEHMPSTGELAHLQADMQGMKSEVRTISTSLVAISRQLELINQHLLNQNQ